MRRQEWRNPYVPTTYHSIYEKHLEWNHGDMVKGAIESYTPFHDSAQQLLLAIAQPRCWYLIWKLEVLSHNYYVCFEAYT